MKQSRATLKQYFEKNDRPTQGQFSDLIDSVLNLREEGIPTILYPKGDWALDYSYVNGDIVYYEGSTFYCLVDHVSSSENQPPTLPTTVNTYWKAMSIKGDKGLTGDDGRSIVSITYFNSTGNVDTYVIEYSEGENDYFTVTNGTNGEKGDPGNSYTDLGAFDAEATYNPRDIVQYDGSTYACILESTGNLPTDTNYFRAWAIKGKDGNGDMNKETYDPNEIEGDAFDMDNMVEGDTNKLVSAAEKSAWSGKQDALQFTPENVANKKTTLTNSDTDFPTTKAVNDSLAGKQAALVSGTNIKTINGESILGSGDLVIEQGGASLWTSVDGTRVSNTTFTIAGDQTAIFKKGMIVKWKESGVDKWGMVSIPSTYSSPNTTITIIGCVCASGASDFAYCLMGAENWEHIFKFVVAGTIGATATNVGNTAVAFEPYLLIGAELWVGNAGTTNSTTVDININGTTAFTTKPTLATTVASSPTPFTADTAKSFALGDKITIDIDAVQSTPATDLYVKLYVMPSRFLTLS